MAATSTSGWEQPVVLGSAGGPRLALPILGADTFFIVNGDTLTDVDLSAMAAAHAASDARVTLALVPNREFDRYGGVVIDAEQRVTGFTPRGPKAKDTWHFIGVQVAHASVFAGLPAGRPLRSIGGTYDELVHGGRGAVRAFCCEAQFWDVGTAADYWRTSQALSASGVDAGKRTQIDTSARVTASILWDDVEVGADAVVDRCIIADGVRVPAGAAYRETILLRANDTTDELTALPLGL